MNNIDKARFFGRSIGQKVKTPNEKLEDLLGIRKEYESWRVISLFSMDEDTAVEQFWDISDCQIIGRRITQMTGIEKAECYKLSTHKTKLKTINDHETYVNYDIVNYLDSIGVYDNKYFESQNGEPAWCVEAE